MRTRRNRGGGLYGKLTNTFGIGNKSNIDDPKLQDKLSKIDDFFNQLDATQIDKRPTIDAEVSELGGLTGYHMRALINAISVCNSTMKMRAFEMPTTGGDGCKERAKIIREALRTLLKYSERSDALGYIGAGRALVNSAGFAINSVASAPGTLQSNAKSLYSYMRGPPQTEQVQPGQESQPPQPQQTQSSSSNTQAAVGTSLAGSSGFWGIGGKTRRRR